MSFDDGVFDYLNYFLLKGEVDIVWVDAATQKAISLAEIKWTDKFFEDPSQLKSLRKFLAANDGIRKIIVTTKSKRAVKQLLMTTRFSLCHPLCMLIGCLDIFSRRKQTKFFFRSEMHNKRKKISYFNICL